MTETQADGYKICYSAGQDKTLDGLNRFLDKWLDHAERGMKVGNVAYFQGQVALIVELWDWISKQRGTLNTEL